MQENMQDLKTDLSKAQHIVFLTGAGVSTHSNIPDYRSKSGIYNGSTIPPEIILSEDTLYHRPNLFYQFVMNNMYFPKAQPNFIHKKIADICNKKGTLITQNIDCLDTKAGNKHVIEFHGNLYNIYCTKCLQTLSYKTYQKSYKHYCGGIIRPNIVLYGEGIDEQKLTKSISNIQKADLIIIIGTSFVVYPFAGLLAYRQKDTPVWAINKTKIDAPSIRQITGDALTILKDL
ncbi:NAD-dependent protein deacylase [Lactobacillus mulieris]|uniref:protein acetyllysine N-acetyltransferase n=1 Tax=Lactobacillus mulieris TaxID=2508708 RepID=A0AAW5WWI3_9LACO|nr:NAD-dependent protein deacylase [Lactobacillus mulieris]MCZ3621929.1 NAD-dependent protein deacylase [Lactobacillus mulieris]MCZ3623626.1 NAD-dependent protein deacylase [Lactobacillus mulieris]MCZ3635936.1 NAD-dependent protein deacylase [Lactobacillus mulieris]MCZ3689666.1 NAD-dependent protein deacylase [Lactobacillus mulieris]MCZ3695669.1 NAD-dependent protein deacylase [Lactobacillus mulieris]